MSFEIKQLRIFPFKSLKGIDVDECEIDEYGFRHDRIYMLVHKGPSGYTAVTQRGEPVMSLIGQKVEGDQLVLSYLDNSEKEVSLRLPLDITVWPTDLPAIDMELWSYPFTGLDIGNGQIKEFFIKFFTTFGVNKFTADNLTVIVAKTHRNLTDTHKLLDRENDASPSFQDIYPGTIMTTESYNDLCEHVSYLDDEAKISMDSFRMNILVETDEPWIEDDWKKLKIGGHGWVVAGPTPRCSMPAVDQDSGKTRKNRHPLPSLNRFRVLEKGGWPNFGLYLLNEDVNYKLHVGDKVQVIE